MRVTLIHNPGAGDDDLSRAELRSTVVQAGHEVVAVGSVEEAGWQDVLRQSMDLVVAAGGDGTLRRVFRALVGYSPAGDAAAARLGEQHGCRRPNVALAPSADPGDGRLDLVQIRPEDQAQLSSTWTTDLPAEGGPPPGCGCGEARGWRWEFRTVARSTPTTSY